MSDFINSWKDENIFQEQLSLNCKELSSPPFTYPEHWIIFIKFLKKFKTLSLLDIGCGCGAYYELCKRHVDEIDYTGIDYAKEAIDLAKKTWKYENFIVKNYKSLTQEYIKQFDLIHMGAMLDVLPNGDEALEFIMSLTPKAILIGRMKFTDKDSYYTVYKAYDKIDTYAYYHNKEKFLKLCLKYNYNKYQIENNFYLTRN